MMKKLFFYIVACMTGLCSFSSAYAAVIDYTYDLSGDSYHTWQPGAEGKRQTVNVAIRIDDPGLEGARVTGFTVPVPGKGASSFKGWLSKELKVSDRKIVADICEQDVTVGDAEAETMNVVFDTPHAIPEGGLYVGYSFKIGDELTEFVKKPIAIVDGDDPDGLYVYMTACHVNWRNAKDLGNPGVSAMHVSIEGDFPKCGVKPSIGSEYFTVSGDKTPLTVTIFNQGMSEVTDIDYSYQIGDGVKGEGKITLPQPLKALWNTKCDFDVELSSVTDLGTLPLKFTVEKVNGENNGCPSKTTESVLEVFPFAPKNRPLVEEFTGFWCGFCPRLYVTMETMHKKYGDEFVGVSYHNRDELTTVPNFTYPVEIPDETLPCVSINRIDIGNEIVGDTEQLWLEARRRMPAAEISVDINWKDESCAELVATSKVNFVRDCNGKKFKLAYFLVADNLSDESWKQTNYYATGKYGNLVGEYADRFNPGTGSEEVTGLTYNNIVLTSKGVFGTDAGYPDKISAGDSYTNDFTFEIPEDFFCIVNYPILEPVKIPVDKSKLRIVAAIIDAESSAVINSDSSAYSGSGAGVDTVSAPGSPVRTVYYDLTGRNIAAPHDGIYIRVDEYSDGKRQVTKEVITLRM